jgi:hypothetical protein
MEEDDDEEQEEVEEEEEEEEEEEREEQDGEEQGEDARSQKRAKGGKEAGRGDVAGASRGGDSGSWGVGERSLPRMCPYGASCYRKNPAHFVEFAHQRDDSQGHLNHPNHPNNPDNPRTERKAASAKSTLCGICPGAGLAFIINIIIIVVTGSSSMAIVIILVVVCTSNKIRVVCGDVIFSSAITVSSPGYVTLSSTIFTPFGLVAAAGRSTLHLLRFVGRPLWTPCGPLYGPPMDSSVYPLWSPYDPV